jgi:hypothetical protein
MNLTNLISITDLIPRTDGIFKEVTDQAMRSVAGKKEQEIKGALDANLPGWTLATVKARCRIVSYANTPVQELWLDNRAILEIHPIDFGQPELDETTQSYKQTITQKFRRL